MKYQALYRKYRPATFDDVYGQKIIVETIKNAIKNEKISHAYLFYGSRGTGKTSLAKLIGKTINCMNKKNGEACEKCEVCLQIANNSYSDIIEIDAASNNGVDEIREIKNKVNLVPTLGDYKIYIIDEVHMLSMGAFNALLKTLEEPPAHVIFILATTEIHKVPDTIKSRCQIFSFKKVTDDEIIKKLNFISKAENINLREDVSGEIARLSNGGMRDAISLLDQLNSFNREQPTLKDLEEITGTISEKEIEDLISNILLDQDDVFINKIDELYSNGKDIVNIAEQILFKLKDIIISYKIPGYFNDIKNKRLYKIGIIDYPQLLKLVNKLIQELDNLKKSSHPKLIFEVICISLSNSNQKLFPGKYLEENSVKTKKKLPKEEPETKERENSAPDVIDKTENNTKEIVEETEETVEEEKTTKILIEDLENKKDQIDLVKKIRINNTLALASKKILIEIKSLWNNISAFVVDPNLGPTAGLLLDGEVKVASENSLIIAYPYESMTFRAIYSILKIEKIITEVIGREYKVIAVDEDEWLKIQDNYISKFRKGEKINLIEDEIELISSEKGVKELEKLTKEFLNTKEEVEKPEEVDAFQEIIKVYGSEIVEIN